MPCLKCLQPIDTPKTAYYGLHPECFTEWFHAPCPTEFISLQRRSSGSGSQGSSNLSVQNTSFFHGKFKKYSAELGEESYILKMRQADAAELPEVEYLCNQIGKLLGIPVAEFYYISFNEEKIFVTKNFIKAGTPTDLQHLYHFRPDDQHSCKGIIHAIHEKTQSRFDVGVFIKTTLFDALIGNHDRHGRNLGFITTSKGSSLSPIYDNVSGLSLEEGFILKTDFNPTGKISTQNTFEPSMRDYIQEFKKLGFLNEITEFYQAIKLPQLLELIDNSFCSDDMKQAIKKLLTKRFEELKGELTN
jgi:hypothetical protein